MNQLSIPQAYICNKVGSFWQKINIYIENELYHIWVVTIYSILIFFNSISFNLIYFIDHYTHQDLCYHIPLQYHRHSQLDKNTPIIEEIIVILYQHRS